MGSCQSSSEPLLGNAQPSSESYNELAGFGLDTTHVQSLFKVFSEIDQHNNRGYVLIEDLFVFLGMECNDFSQRLVDMFDSSQRGWLDFGEFCVFAYINCMQNFSQLVLLAFHLYDTDGDGTVSVQELKRLINDGKDNGCYDTQTAMGIIAQITEQLRDKLKKAGTAEDELPSDDDLTMELPQFASFIEGHKIILAHVHQCSEIARKRILSPKFWHRVEAHQKKMQQQQQNLRGTTESTDQSEQPLFFLANVASFRAKHVREVAFVENGSRKVTEEFTVTVDEIKRSVVNNGKENKSDNTPHRSSNSKSKDNSDRKSSRRSSTNIKSSGENSSSSKSHRRKSSKQWKAGSKKPKKTHPHDNILAVPVKTPPRLKLAPLDVSTHRPKGDMSVVELDGDARSQKRSKSKGEKRKKSSGNSNGRAEKHKGGARRANGKVGAKCIVPGENRERPSSPI